MLVLNLGSKLCPSPDRPVGLSVRACGRHCCGALVHTLLQCTAKRRSVIALKPDRHRVPLASNGTLGRRFLCGGSDLRIFSSGPLPLCISLRQKVTLHHVVCVCCALPILSSENFFKAEVCGFRKRIRRAQMKFACCDDVKLCGAGQPARKFSSKILVV